MTWPFSPAISLRRLPGCWFLWRAIDPLRVAPAEASTVDSEYVLDFDMFVRNEKV
jgi:hypothetical protein